MIMFLGDVDLRVRRKEPGQKRAMISDEEKIIVFMDRRLRATAPPSKTARCTPVKYYRNQSEQKSNATVRFRRFD